MWEPLQKMGIKCQDSQTIKVRNLNATFWYQWGVRNVISTDDRHDRLSHNTGQQSYVTVPHLRLAKGERQSSDWRRILDRRVNFRALVYWCFMTKTCPHSQLHQQIWGSRKLSIFKVQNPSKYLFEWLVGCLRLFFAPFVKKFQEFLWTFDKVTHLSELSKSVSWKEIWVKQCWVWSDLD